MKKRIKYIIAYASLLAIGFMSGACADSVNAGQDNPLKIWYENTKGDYQTLKIVDDETGVNYVVVSIDSGRVAGGKGISIYPRYNADGSLYVSK